MNVLDHAYSEIVKLNGVEFKSNLLEEAKTKHKDGAPDKQNSAHHQSTNYHKYYHKYYVSRQKTGRTQASLTATTRKPTTRPATATSTATQTTI